MRPFYRSASLVFRIVALYFLLSVFWLLGTYFLLHRLINNPLTITQWQISIGILYVLITSLLLYAVLNHKLRRSEKTQKELEESQTRYRYLFENSPISLWEEDFSKIKYQIDQLRQEGVEDFAAYFEQNPQVIKEFVARISAVDVNQATIAAYRAANREELLGNLQHILPEDCESILRRELLAVANGETLFESYGTNARLDGERFEILLRWQVVPGSEKDYSRVIVSVIDVTEQRRTEELLRAAETRYRTMVEQISATIYINRVDAHHSNIYSSPKIMTLTGYSPEEWQSQPGLWAKILHPDDSSRVMAYNEATNRSGELFDIEYRILRKDGEVVWLRDQAVMIWDEQSHSPVWQGVLTNITIRKQVEEALQQSEARFRLLLESQGEGTLLFNLIGAIVYVNPAAEELFGVEPGTLVKYTLGDFIAGEGAANMIELVRKAPPGQNLSVEIMIRTPVKEKRWLLITLSPWYEAQGQIAGGLAICRDITARKITERKLRYQSTHDILTGLYNRLYFEDQLKQMEQDGVYPLSLGIADVDGLKQINDEYGHLTGDQLLKRLAGVFKNAVRKGDIVARIGGDEFVILLPNTDAAAAQKVFHRLHELLEIENKISNAVPIQVSIGFATAGNHEEFTLLFHQADQVMYAKKGLRRPPAQPFHSG